MPESFEKDAIDLTRTRLLAAAADVFGARGYHTATIRQIVEQAGSNVAAVNYHFQNKAGLYSAVFHDLIRQNRRHNPFDAASPTGADPVVRLGIFIRSLLTSIMDQHGAQPALGQLMIREMIEPTHALDEVIRDMIRPKQQYLTALVNEIVERTLSAEEMYFTTTSIMSQIVFHKHCQAVVDRLFPERDLSAAGIERHAAYLIDFCYAGLLKMKKSEPTIRNQRKPVGRVLKRGQS
jgi:TetR/AcrR family transcriptional regulator, regulator of cefoperazone and chloramphenicol sensitivity